MLRRIPRHFYREKEGHNRRDALGCISLSLKVIWRWLGEAVDDESNPSCILSMWDKTYTWHMDRELAA
jgi:hypothetical protein